MQVRVWPVGVCAVLLLCVWWAWVAGAWVRKVLFVQDSWGTLPAAPWVWSVPCSTDGHVQGLGRYGSGSEIECDV